MESDSDCINTNSMGENGSKVIKYSMYLNESNKWNFISNNMNDSYCINYSSNNKESKL